MRGHAVNLLYLLFSLGGVALVVALCALLFGLKGARITAAQSVEAYLAQVLPAFRARSIALGADKKSALVENDVDGTIHLIVAHGDTFVARKLSKRLLGAVLCDGGKLFLRLADFTLPRATLVLADPTTAALWEEKLSGVTR